MKKSEVKTILLYYMHTIEGGYKVTSKDFDILIEKLSTEHHSKTAEQKKKDIDSFLKHKGFGERYYCSECKLLPNNNFYVVIRSINTVYPRRLECKLSENELPEINKNENNNLLSFIEKR